MHYFFNLIVNQFKGKCEKDYITNVEITLLYLGQSTNITDTKDVHLILNTNLLCLGISGNYFY